VERQRLNEPVAPMEQEQSKEIDVLFLLIGVLR
jgi:hypothetical protein